MNSVAHVAARQAEFGEAVVSDFLRGRFIAATVLVFRWDDKRYTLLAIFVGTFLAAVVPAALAAQRPPTGSAPVQVWRLGVAGAGA